MTASKVDSFATRSSHSHRSYNVPDVQRIAVPRVTRRCLFGHPDQDELQKIFKGNQESERLRMLRNYGFDVKTEKYVGHGTLASGETKNSSGASRLCNNKKTPDHKPYKQTCMTDFYSKQKKNKDTEEKHNRLKQSNNVQSYSRKNVNKV